MGKFLFIVPPFMGHVNPTLGLGVELLEKGHQVAWACFDPKIRQRIPDKGIFLLLEADLNETEKKAMEKELTELGKKALYGLDSLRFLYEEVLVPINRGMMDGLNKIIDEYRPDIIINDHQMFSGAVAAVQKNIPYVTSITAPAAIKVNDALPGVYKWESDQIIAFQKSMGIEGDTRLDCSLKLSFVYTSKYFFGEADLPDQYQFIGSILNRNDTFDSFDWKLLESKGDRPKILVSIGTTFDHEQKKYFFRKVVEALENEDMTVTVISDPAIFDHIPANFIVQRNVPQLKLLSYMDAVVCHGGQNTVCEALSNAKPLVVIPIAYDQSYVAGCVVDRGCGVRLNFNRFKAVQLRDAVHSILSDKQYTQNAEAVQKSFVEAGGLSRAVDLLEKLIKR